MRRLIQRFCSSQMASTSFCHHLSGDAPAFSTIANDRWYSSSRDVQRRFPLIIADTELTFTTTARTTALTSSSFTGRFLSSSSSHFPDQLQIKNANKYRKALIAVIQSPKMFHQFQGTGIDILDVYITKDGKLAKVLYTTPFANRRDSLMKKLQANAGKLKGYVSVILKSKNTPRLTFVDAERRKMEFAREEEAFEEIQRERESDESTVVLPDERQR